ncbi:MAG: molybdenum cofactor guanylyltransferase [Pyrinomonadaceae bacterium]|nr:molybdenum cofactor guanylyltransferase [Pyrinomonadaceae bacterium]
MALFSEQFSGYVLAGGKSSRMKTDKAFLEIGGETFLERAIKTLQTVCENRVKIVLNQTQTHFIERLSNDFPHIFDFYENRGALAGIHAALKSCETKYALILAVDLPLITNEAIENLAAITLSSNKFIAVVPRQTDGRLQPLCAAYLARYCLPVLENLMGENDSASVNDFLELIAPRIVYQDKLTADEISDIFFNVNYPADYQEI